MSPPRSQTTKIYNATEQDNHLDRKILLDTSSPACPPHGTSTLAFPLLSTRIANSNATNVAPFANGDRISVGVNPLVNAVIPSAAHTDRMQFNVDVYF